MTNTTKPTKRETLSIMRDSGKFRNMVIELHSTYAVLRLKGKRYRYTLTYDQMWKIGAQNAANEKRLAKAAAKKAKAQP